MELSEGQETLRSFWTNWQKENAGQLPSRRDMDTRENQLHFSNVVVFDVLDDPLDFKYRLVGTRVRENTFGDYTGKTLREMEGKGPGSVIWGLLYVAKENKQPQFEQVPYVGPNKSFMKTTLLFLPLADDHQNVNKIFLVSNFIFGENRTPDPTPGL